MMKFSITGGLLLLFFAVTISSAQQRITFSQYMFHGLIINPAYASSDDALNVTLLHRNQWSGVNGAPSIQNLNAHKYFRNKNVGLGLMIENISFGVTETFDINGMYAYKLKLPDKAGLSFGLKAGMSSYQQNLTDLTLPAQGVNDNSFGYDSRKILFNVGFGIYFETPKFYAGLSVPHILASKLEDGVLPMRQARHYYLAGGYIFDINRDIKLRPQVLIRSVVGTPVSMDLSLAALLKELVWVGFTYKYENSLTGLVEVKVSDEFKFGISYDITSSDLARITPGTYEISLNYRYLKRRPNRVMSPRYF